MEQAMHFNVRIERKRVAVAVRRRGTSRFRPLTGSTSTRYVIVSSECTTFSLLKNIFRFLGAGYYTCIDCDGYRTTDKRIVVMEIMEAVHVAPAMKQMFTRTSPSSLPAHAAGVCGRGPAGRGHRHRHDELVGIVGDEEMEGLELKNGGEDACEAVMASFGMKLNDDFLADST
jgi:thioredoxin reductase (NADPH)